jgi:glucose-1-phosphate cytidylyltransferase
MKVVILAGGMGTRLREETEFRPKPMVEIGRRPILWHIMKTYAHYGFSEFVVCLGYKGDVIRDYFLNYEIRNRDFTVTLGSGELQIHDGHFECGWKITLAETGAETLTASRLARVAKHLDGDLFMVTYGDGVANVDIDRLLCCHQTHGKLATMTAVRPSSRYGELSIAGGLVELFREKPQVDEGWINGGFFVFDKRVLDYVAGDEVSLERDLLPKLSSMQELAVLQHVGFWQCMDTYREMVALNELWQTGRAPWAVWKESH